MKDAIPTFDVKWRDNPNAADKLVTNAATSGSRDFLHSNEPNMPFEGRIPPGVYYLRCSDITDIRNPRRYTSFHATLGVAMWWDNDSWGSVRVPLLPDPKTDTQGRSDFFLHGHGHNGTAGCVGLDHPDASNLFDTIEDFCWKYPNGIITVVVN